MVVFMKHLMGLKASSFMSPQWAVVLAVCVAGFLSTCAKGAPLILQLDPTTLVGHRLVIAIEPLLLEGVTHMNIESNTSVVLLNSTADATNASIIFFDSNSVDTPVTSDALEMVSADVTTEAGLPPTSTAAVMEDSQVTVEATSQPQLRSEQSDIFADDVQNFHKQPLVISPRTRMREMDDVDKFLITFPHRCPPGTRLDEHGECRRPFNVFNDIAEPRNKPMLKRKLKKMMARNKSL